jgi:hypothetical protein
MWYCLRWCWTGNALLLLELACDGFCLGGLGRGRWPAALKLLEKRLEAAIGLGASFAQDVARGLAILGRRNAGRKRAEQEHGCIDRTWAVSAHGGGSG